LQEYILNMILKSKLKKNDAVGSRGVSLLPLSFLGAYHQPVIMVKISLAKVIMIPPARVRKPLER
jgi:hypothetical protein